MLVVLVVSEIRKSIACLIVLRTKDCSNWFLFEPFKCDMFFFQPVTSSSGNGRSTTWASVTSQLRGTNWKCYLKQGLVVTCWERADHLTLVCDVKLCICHFSMWYPGSGVVSWLYRFLIFASFITLYQAICIVRYSFYDFTWKYSSTKI